MEKENTFDSIEKAATGAGFKIAATQPYFIKDALQDSFMYVGKNNPRLYFDPAIRSGISAFASLSNKEEVEQGLAQLEKDINSGQFETIKNAHPSVDGDYLFIEITK